MPSPSAADPVASLAADGVRAAWLAPDRAARRVFSRDPLDPSRIPGAARWQPAAHAERFREVWQD